MALCSLCSGLPFTDFPHISPPWHDGSAEDDEFMVVFFDDNHDWPTVSDLPDPVGFPYHENIGALAESAKACPLCAFVHAGVQAWLVSWHKAAGTKETVESIHQFRGVLPLEERLWLTALPGEDLGFCVWTRNPKGTGIYEGLYLMMLVGFSVEERMFIPPLNLTSSTPDPCVARGDVFFPDSSLKDQFRLRPMDPDSGSSRSLDRAASWVQKCTDDHEECSDASDVLLPSRVLDVETEGDLITLVDGSSISGNSGRYACLSYCWGDAPPYTTSRATIQARRSGMLLKDMPQTFVDAIKITRRLGLKYLWIDSLCICQDDAEDWAREAGRMADVYSNAYVVIAANRSSDSTGGCFDKRAPRQTALIRIPIMGSKEDVHVTRLFPTDHSKFPDINFSREPLSERGWVLQERTMAQRTLHYNDRQMYFECLHGIEAEDGYIESPWTKNVYYQRFSTPESAISNWYSLVNEFSQRKLSKATDKLPALSGWAKKLQKAIGADYVGGLWSNTLTQGLAWEGKGERKAASLKEYTGPSWSWASYGGTVSYSGLNDWVIAEVLGWHVELKEDGNPFGEVRDCWIDIRGPVCELKPSSPQSGSRKGGSGAEIDVGIHIGDSWVSVSATVDDRCHYLDLDNRSSEESGEWKNWDLKLMLLCGHLDWEGTDSVEGIVFKEATRTGQRGKMERVGFMSFSGYQFSWVQSHVNSGKWMTITLV